MPDTLASFYNFMEAQEAIRLYVLKYGRGCEIPEDLKIVLRETQAKYEQDRQTTIRE